MSNQEQFHELSFYTLAHKSSNFIHQHVVDAYTAQEADANTKPIAIFFALAGLYLFLEKDYTGRQVQLAHVQMTKGSKDFGKINLPENRGSISVKEVLKQPPGPERDKIIREWCISVWAAFADQRDQVIALTEKLL